MSSESEGASRLRSAFSDSADASGVLMRWRAPKRSTDLGLVYLRGERAKVLGLPMKLIDLAGDFDLEIIRSEGDDSRYLLVLAVTEAIERQQTHTPERRAKLRRRLAEQD